jgi:HK97 family phage prohead protease
MTMIRKLVRAQINTLGEDEVEVVMSTASLARDGHILIPQGCILENYRANPIALWSHDPDLPVGNAENIAVEADQITARVRFAPLGISVKADEVRGLVKAGVIRAVSIGFDPIEGEPLDPKKPRGGQRVSAWELLELSFVSVPSDVGAVVTQRAHGETDMSDKPGDKLPATRQIQGKANGVRQGPVTFKRGLYQVAQLCYLFEELGWQVDMAKWEAECEGDASKLPAMLGAVLAELGDALLAMTAEEIAEALAGRDLEPEEDEADVVLLVEERAHIRAATSPAVRAFRRGLALAKLRAGKTLSDETVRCLREVLTAHEEGVALHRSAMRKHKDGIGALEALMESAGASAADDDGEEDDVTDETSDETEDDEGARANHDFRRRQADLMAFAPAD